MYRNHPAISASHLPTMYDLPSEDPEEPGLPDEFHDVQPDLLKETCCPNADDFFIGADLNLYYDVNHTGWYKRPDWFLVLGAAASESIANSRLSYVMWQEAIAPFLMVELLSPGTEAEDLGQTLRVVGKPPTKWQVYEQILKVPYYVIFDQYSSLLRVFSLQATEYKEVKINNQRFWLAEIELGLGIWQGLYQGMEGQWLRWYDKTGNWIPTNQEEKLKESQRADQESQRANQESQRADQESQRADRESQRADLLAAKLRELGIDMEETS